VATADATASMGLGSVERLRRALHGERDAIALMALRKEPFRRFPTVAALGEAVLGHLKGQPVLARPDSAGYRLRKLVARNKLAAAAVALALLAMGGGTMVALRQARQARAQAVITDRERRTAERVSGFLQNIFAAADASWPGEDSRPGPNTTVREVIDAAAARVETELAEKPDVAQVLHRTLALIYSALSQPAKDEVQARKGLERQRARGAAPLEIAHSLHHLAVGPEHTVIGLGLFNLARIELATGRVRQALATHRRGVAQLRHLPRTHEDVARGETFEAAILLALGQTEEAERLARRSLVIREQVFAAGDWRIAETEGILGRILRARGREGEALVLLRKSRDNLLRSMGPDHPRTRAAEDDLAAP